MADIQFHSSEIAGFFAELLNGDLNDPANPIYSFKEENSSEEKLESKRWGMCINKLHDAIQNGEVRTIDQLTHFVFDKQPGHKFTKEQQAEIAKRLKTEYAQYSDAYQKHASTAEQWAAKNQELENDPKLGYQAELDKLCDFFGVSKNQTFHAILAFTPNKRNEGQAWPRGFVQYSDFKEYQTSKDNPQEFVDGTAVQIKKISTPLHEATHVMFKQAGLEEKLNNPQSPGMRRLIKAMEREIDLKNGKRHIEPGPPSVRWNAVRAIDEAIAAATGKMVDIKYGKCGKDPKNPDVKEWYAGFKPANDLAPVAFSLIQEHMKNGKPLDDRFFDVMAERFEQRKLENVFTKQKLARCYHYLAHKQSKTNKDKGIAQKLQARGIAKNNEIRALLELRTKDNPSPFISKNKKER